MCLVKWNNISGNRLWLLECKPHPVNGAGERPNVSLNSVSILDWLDVLMQLVMCALASCTTKLLQSAGQLDVLSAAAYAKANKHILALVHQVLEQLNKDTTHGPRAHHLHRNAKLDRPVTKTEAVWEGGLPKSQVMLTKIRAQKAGLLTVGMLVPYMSSISTGLVLKMAKKNGNLSKTQQLCNHFSSDSI